MRNSKRNYFIKVKENGRKVLSYHSHSKSRFLKMTRSINWQNNPTVYIRVSYGKNYDHKGLKVNFFNDGEYQNINQFYKAFEAFNE